MSGELSADLAPEQIQRARRRSTLVLIGAFWIFTFLVLTVRAAVTDSPPFNVIAPRRLMIAAFGTLLCLAMVYVLGRLRSRSFPERIVWGVAGALVMAVLLNQFASLVNRVLFPIPGITPLRPGESAQWTMAWLGYFLAWTGTHLALTYHWEAEDQQRRLSAMKELAQNARIAALRYQLNPHFLFNTLNSISSLVLERRNREAEAMLLNLSTFIRTTLAPDPRGTIELGEEIDLQRLYLEIEEARFSERMQIAFAVPQKLEQASVPPLILQPLVENAVRHGVDRSESMTTIRIAAAQVDDTLRLVVEDDGAGIGTPRQGSGLGLANVRERLQAHFGERARLRAGPGRKGGFRAEITLPLALAS
jgi:signal transduction histidine kinase